jgi:hypothetical protein
MLSTSAAVIAVARPAGMVTALTSRWRVGSIAMTAALARAVPRWSTLAWRLREGATGEIGVRIRAAVEGPKRHECGQEGGTRNRERQMVEQEPAPLIAVSAKWLDRRLTGLPCRHLLLTVSKRDVSGLLLDRDVVRRASPGTQPQGVMPRQREQRMKLTSAFTIALVAALLVPTALLAHDGHRRRARRSDIRFAFRPRGR